MYSCKSFTETERWIYNVIRTPKEPLGLKVHDYLYEGDGLCICVVSSKVVLKRVISSLR